MFTKKKIFSLSKLYSVYEETPEGFLDETDVDKYFCRNISTFHSPTTELFELANDPVKNLLHSKCFISANQSYSSDLFSRKKTAIPKRKLSLYSTVWVNLSKLLIKPPKYRRFFYPNLNLRLDLQK